MQDLVEKQLIFHSFAATAKAYILYRQRRTELRQERGEVPKEVRDLVTESKNISAINFQNMFITPLIRAGWMRQVGAKLGWKQLTVILLLCASKLAIN